MDSKQNTTSSSGSGAPASYAPQAGKAALEAVVVFGPPGALCAACEAARPFAGAIHAAASPDATLGLITRHRPDLLVILASSALSADLAVLRRVRREHAATAVIVVDDAPNVESAVQCVRAGALDYLPGPLNVERLARLLEGLARESQLGCPQQTRLFAKDCPPGVAFVGRSAATGRMLEAIRLVAESRCNPVLILGETGTGKELAAQAVHAWRHGRADNFIAVNCAALTANLLESELFGHTRGAFTGADRDKVGLFEAAAEGSIFLDEISEMPLDLQAKLLRVLQERTFRRVGSTRDTACNCTVIASSNRDLQQEVAAGRFRRDLYYRLAIFPITLAPLRSADRREDVPLLAEHFVAMAQGSGATGGLSNEAVSLLMSHNWPGNVRELRNVIERALILERTDRITAGSIIIDGAVPSPAATSTGTPRSTADLTLEAAEREFITRALKETGYQRTRAAALLGITRATLHAKLKRYDIKVPGGSPAAAGA